MMSQADVGGMLVEVEPSPQYSITFYYLNALLEHSEMLILCGKALAAQINILHRLLANISSDWESE